MFRKSMFYYEDFVRSSIMLDHTSNYAQLASNIFDVYDDRRTTSKIKETEYYAYTDGLEVFLYEINYGISESIGNKV